MKETLVDVGHQMAYADATVSDLSHMLCATTPPFCISVDYGGIERTDLLAGASNWPVIVIQNNADLIHQTDLLFIVTLKLAAARSVCLACGEDFTGERGIDLGEESGNVVRRDLRRTCDCRGCAHFGQKIEVERK